MLKNIILNLFPRSSYLVLYAIVLLSFMHVVLRPNEESHISLYILALPFSLIYIGCKTMKKEWKIYVGFGILLLYNYLLTYFYCNIYSYYLVSSYHYLCLFNVLMILIYLYRKMEFRNIYFFLKAFFHLSIVIAVLEIISGVDLPNVAGHYNYTVVSAFTYNVNEFSVAMASFLPLYMIFEKKSKEKFLFIAIALWLMYYNDSKITLISCILAFMCFYANKHVHPIIIILFLVSIPVTLSFIGNIEITFRDYSMSLNDLLLGPIQHILSGNEIGIVSSIGSRVNAVINAIKEWYDSYFMGIGIGGTLHMMERLQLYGAKSIHNLPIQLLTENGIVIFFMYVWLLFRFIKLLVKKYLQADEQLFVFAFVCFFIGSMGSSVGIFSNYYFWANLFFTSLIVFDKNRQVNSLILCE